MDDELARALRDRMVEQQIVNRGVVDRRVLAAMRTVPREQFAAGASLQEAYGDNALPIGMGQTISQPYMVARMLELLALRGHERVLEVGTGLGYEAAVLSRIAREVVTVERIGALAEKARDTIRGLGYDNVEVVHGDGALGYAPRAPYDGIVVAAAAPAVPQALVEQLAEGGCLIAPVGSAGDQTLVRMARAGRRILLDEFDRCVFVPLICPPE